MNIGYTPGPWMARDLDELSIKIVLDRHYVHECINIADVFVMSGNLGEEVPRAVANAHLIAAAPDLLEAIEQIMIALTHSSCGWSTDADVERAYQICKNAFKKAKGL